MRTASRQREALRAIILSSGIFPKSEYCIGLTTYHVKISFSSDTDESLEDIINRLIAREVAKSA